MQADIVSGTRSELNFPRTDLAKVALEVLRRLYHPRPPRCPGHAHAEIGSIPPKPDLGYGHFEAEMAAGAARGDMVPRLIVGARALGHKVVDHLVIWRELMHPYAGELSDRGIHFIIDRRDCTFVDAPGCIHREYPLT